MKHSKNVVRLIVDLSIVLILGLCSCNMPWMWSGGEEEFSFTPEPSGFKIPQNFGDTTNRDHDFWGQGPYVRASAKLDYSGGKELYMILRLRGDATNNDGTWGEGVWRYKIWTVPSPHCTIVDIVTSDSSYVEYTDSGMDMDILEPLYGSLVNKFEIFGDTWGSDVGLNVPWPYFCMNTHFNTVRVKVKIEP